MCGLNIPYIEFCSFLPQWKFKDCSVIITVGINHFIYQWTWNGHLNKWQRMARKRCWHRGGPPAPQGQWPWLWHQSACPLSMVSFDPGLGPLQGCEWHFTQENLILVGSRGCARASVRLNFRSSLWTREPSSHLQTQSCSFWDRLGMVSGPGTCQLPHPSPWVSPSSAERPGPCVRVWARAGPSLEGSRRESGLSSGLRVYLPGLWRILHLWANSWRLSDPQLPKRDIHYNFLRLPSSCHRGSCRPAARGLVWPRHPGLRTCQPCGFGLLTCPFLDLLSQLQSGDNNHTFLRVLQGW